MMYGSYREGWHSKKRYQFDSYQGDSEYVFVYEPVERDIALKYVPTNNVPVDAVATNDGLRVCNHCSQTELLEPIWERINFKTFVQSQPEYISQNYADLHFDVTVVSLYNLVKEKK